MDIEDIVRIISGKVVCGADKLDNKVNYAFASDLMSDVLCVNRQNLMLITGLANIQAVRTAEFSDISVIVFARDKKVTQEMLSLGAENDMVFIETPFSMFRISGELYNAGVLPLF